MSVGRWRGRGERATGTHDIAVIGELPPAGTACRTTVYRCPADRVAEFWLRHRRGSMFDGRAGYDAEFILSLFITPLRGFGRCSWVGPMLCPL